MSCICCKFTNLVFQGNKGKPTVNVLLLHVIQELPITKSLLDKPVRSKEGKATLLSQHALAIYNEMEDDIKKVIKEKINKFESTEGVKIEYTILYGNPANKL